MTIRFQRMLHHIHPPLEIPRFLVLSHDGTDASGREECRNSRPTCPDALRKGSLRHQVKFNFLFKNHLLKQFILANVSADMFTNLPSGKQHAHGISVHPHVVADGGEVLHTLANQGADQVLRNTTQAKSSDHDGGAIENVADGLVGVGNNFVHRGRIVKQIHHGGTETLRNARQRTYHSSGEQ